MDLESFLPRTADKIIAAIIGAITLGGLIAAGVRKWVDAPLKAELKTVNDRIGLEPRITVKDALDGIGQRIDWIKEVDLKPLQSKVSLMAEKQDQAEKERNAIRDELLKEFRTSHKEIMDVLQGSDGVISRVARLEERTRKQGE